MSTKRLEDFMGPEDVAKFHKAVEIFRPAKDATSVKFYTKTVKERWKQDDEEKKRKREEQHKRAGEV